MRTDRRISVGSIFDRRRAASSRLRSAPFGAITIVYRSDFVESRGVRSPGGKSADDSWESHVLLIEAPRPRLSCRAFDQERLKARRATSDRDRSRLGLSFVVFQLFWLGNAEERGSNRGGIASDDGSAPIVHLLWIRFLIVRFRSFLFDRGIVMFVMMMRVVD